MTRMFTAALLTLVLGAATAAAMGPLDVSAGVGVHSKYVWRGQIVTPEAVVQPELGLGLAGLSIGVWGNVDLTEVNGYETSLTETDWSVGYGFSLPLVSFGVGFIYYDFPSRGPLDTSELYVGGEADVLFSPHVWIYHDVDEIKGTYVTAGGSWSRDLAETAELKVGVDLGWSSEGMTRGYFGVETAAASDVTIAAKVPWRVAPLVTVEPHVSWATLLGDAKDAVAAADRDTDTVFFGVTARVSF